MCGIAGVLGTRLPALSAERVLALLRHRGPDEENVVHYEHGTLICARLQVMDPAPRALQPLYDERGRVAAACNGEIYNSRQLASDLGKRGHILRTTCDAEVLPHLYEEHGARFPWLLRGMFGLAVLDMDARRLILARDRWGVKPLYFARTKGANGEYLAFASELNALLACGVEGRLSGQAICDYAALGYIPAPETFYDNIYALEPGEMIDARVLPDGALSWRRGSYHRWTVAPDPSIRTSTAIAACEHLLETAVTAQSQADVPVGILLSGGIDSSLVAAMQSRQDRAVETFSMRFRDAAYDESWAARLTSEHLGIRNTAVDLPPGLGTFDEIAAVLKSMGQPFSNSSIFALRALAERVRQNVTVCLSGEGGDEAFGGYQIFRDFADGLKTAGVPLANVSDRQLCAAIEARYRLIDAGTHRRLCLDTDFLPVSRFFEPTWDYADDPRSADPSSRAERLIGILTEVQTRLVLANDYLVKADMATMAHGLELRVPFLDEDLFSYALTLPRALKASRSQMKLVLRELAATMLPEAVSSKPKQGFSVPLYEWLAPNVRDEIADVILAPDSKLPDFFQPHVYRRWVTAFQRAESLRDVHEIHLFDRVIMLLALELQLRAARSPQPVA